MNFITQGFTAKTKLIGNTPLTRTLQSLTLVAESVSAVSAAAVHLRCAPDFMRDAIG